MKRFAVLILSILLVVSAFPAAYFAIVDLDDFHDPLLNAARDGDTARLQQLLADGSDPNMFDYYNNTPLSVAAHFGQTEVVQVLIIHGANIDGRPGTMTPLACAVYSGHPDTAEYLLRNGADPDVADKYGTTPVAISARKGDSVITRLLLDFGANIEHTDRRGWRPLHVALRSTRPSDSDRLATVKTLLEYGADPNATNPGGFETDYQVIATSVTGKSCRIRAIRPLQLRRAMASVKS